MRVLTVIEEHVTNVAHAVEQGLEEKDAVSALAGLRREVTAFQDHLVKARLEHFHGNGDPRQRARAAEVLDLLESTCQSNLQSAGLTTAQASHRDEGKR